ncbi:MAG TPA: hypothetical protein VFA44_08015 [Gaiellaceae bacterium]|nr:hypothetical protein [Gaiellaceae bacterium]
MRAVHSPRRRGGRLSRPLVASLGLLVFFVFVPLALATGLTSRASAAATPTNTSPPTIVGTPTQGRILQASPGSWQGSKPMRFSFQWSECDVTGSSCTQIAGATDRIFTPMTAGRTLVVSVTASNAAGSSSASSAPTVPVRTAPAGAPVATTAPSISGALAVGSTVTADRGSWTGDRPMLFRYKWRLCAAAGGPCDWYLDTPGPGLRLGPETQGHALRVVVVARNAAGKSYALSPATSPVQGSLMPDDVTPPTITGTAREGRTLHGHAGTWAGARPMAFRLRWLRCDRDGLACLAVGSGHAYTLAAADVGHRVRLAVTAANRFGAATARSSATAVVVSAATPPPPVPQNTGAPTVSGTPEQGQVLTATTGSWSGATPMTFFYQWARCDALGGNCVPVTGSLAQPAYTVTAGDVGHRLIVQVKAHNGYGDGFADSAPTAVVTAAPAQPFATNVVSVAAVSLPDRLVVDRVQFSPGAITSRAQPLVLRVHVSEVDHGRSVSGALVLGMAVPFNRLSSEPEVPTGPDGWATLTYRVRPTFALRRGNLVVMFVRARKPGDDLLAGVSTRRLIAVAVA